MTSHFSTTMLRVKFVGLHLTVLSNIYRFIFSAVRFTLGLCVIARLTSCGSKFAFHWDE